MNKTEPKVIDFYWNTKEFKMILNLFVSTRKRHNLSQYEMAKKLQINQSKYNRYETGKQDIPISFFLNFLSKFDLKMEILEGFSEFKSKSELNSIVADNIQNSTISQKNEKTAAETSVLSAQLQAAETRLQEKDAIINQLTRTNEKLIEILGSRS